MLEMVGALMGLIFLYLQLIVSPFVWLASLLMAVIYIVVYYDNQIYGYMVVYCVYFAMSLYGLYQWQKLLGQEKKQFSKKGLATPKDTEVLYFMPLHYWLLIFLLIVLTSLIFYAVILFLSNSSPKVLDLLISSMSLVSFWMLTQKWAEQWLLLIIVNILSMILFFETALFYTFILHFIYFIASFIGYFKWWQKARFFTLKKSNKY